MNDKRRNRRWNVSLTLHLLVVLMLTLIMLCSALLTAVIFFMLIRSGTLPMGTRAVPLLPGITLLVSIILATPLSILISRRALKPLYQLTAATREIAKGNFDVRVATPEIRSELSELIDSFNEMAQELGGIEMFRKDFINNFSHEFKTPIVSIRGFARQLQQDNLTPEQRREYSGIIISEAERLTNMANNTLQLTRFENLEIIPEKAVFSLDEQLRGCILLLEKQWEAKEIEFHIDLDPLVFYGNEEMLAQVWLNLLGNAIKFSHAGGVISVFARAEDNAVAVTIADNGCGMDAETIRHIYEKFYQGDSAHASEGNGLGLSLAKRIVDLSHGTITVESAPDEGAVFTVRLPRV